MHLIKSFTVLPDTPPALSYLSEMAYNMWFAWNHEARELFERLDVDLWRECRQNPVRMLCLIPQAKLEAFASDSQYLTDLELVHHRFRRYMKDKTWFQRQFGTRNPGTIAYFSCEFGIHESVPNYSGGLGGLAGDHMKSASDLGIPIAGVGLLYRQGYFRQYLNAEGMQQELYPENDWYSMPVRQVKGDDDLPLVLSMPLGGETVYFTIWQVNVGRNPLYLLDTNLEQNAAHLRQITVRLYDSDRDVRIRQEILLGIGGVMALEALGHEVQVYHINEGHSAFLLVERLRCLVQTDGLSIDEAKEVVWASSVFTTHTPVPAGNERFDVGLVQHYLGRFVESFGMTWGDFLGLGRENPTDPHEEFCMTVLALRLAAHTNAVSKLHGEVSRQMWQHLYPGIPEREIPIHGLTNGAHLRSWLNPQISNLFLRYLGPSAVNELAEFSIWGKTEQIPDEELWKTREFCRSQFVEFVRRHVKWQCTRRGASGTEIKKATEVLDPKILTIGFARRFATYKRGALFLRNVERLENMLFNDDRPVQFVIAGKSHPADYAGKEVIKKIVDYARQPHVRGRVVFLEDYDISVAREMVQGVDVWLNNPRRPLEASGTSGMKAVFNGGLNLSILDGWWDEAYEPGVGWSIGLAEIYHDHELQDNIESELLYGALENEIIPMFYDRDAAGTPKAWVAMMKKSIATLGMRFNSHRMLDEYNARFYQPAEKLVKALRENDFEGAKELTKWRSKIASCWDKVAVSEVSSDVDRFVSKGQLVNVEAKVCLEGILPENVIVEVYHGWLDSQAQFSEVGNRTQMALASSKGKSATFTASFRCERGGHYGYTVRILPGHKNLAVPFLPGFLKWM